MLGGILITLNLTSLALPGNNYIYIIMVLKQGAVAAPHII